MKGYLEKQKQNSAAKKIERRIIFLNSNSSKRVKINVAPFVVYVLLYQIRHQK